MTGLCLQLWKTFLQRGNEEDEHTVSPSLHSELQNDLHYKSTGQMSNVKFTAVQIIAVEVVTDKKAVSI